MSCAPAVRTGWRRVLAGCWWHGGVLEGGVAVAMVSGTGALMGHRPGGAFLLLAFCGTLLVYGLDRTPRLSPEDRLDHPARWRWRKKHPLLFGGLALGALLGALWALSHLGFGILVAGGAFALPALGYALPLFREGRRLKDVGPLKPFAVAGAWAAGSTLLPALAGGASLAVPVPVLVFWGGYRFLFVLPNLLLADAVDHEADLGGARHASGGGHGPRRLAAGLLGSVVIGGALALFFFQTDPVLVAADLAGPVLLLPFVAVEPSRRRLARAADLAMLGPALTAGAAGLV